jgi:hypothetical protein
MTPDTRSAPPGGLPWSFGTYKDAIAVVVVVLLTIGAINFFTPLEGVPSWYKAVNGFPLLVIPLWLVDSVRLPWRAWRWTKPLWIILEVLSTTVGLIAVLFIPIYLFRVRPKVVRALASPRPSPTG